MELKELKGAERFEIAFNRIHQKLKEISKNKYTDQFNLLLKEAKEHQNIFRQYYDKLEQFAKLRNALMHEKLKPNYYIAEPNVEVVQEIEKICKLLWHPSLVKSVSSFPVQYFNTHSPIRIVLEAISHHGYSQYPIYNDGQFKGLITEGGIAKWSSQNIIIDLISIEDISVQDILKVEKPHNVRFISRKNIFELENLFETAFAENKKLEAVIVTENGRSSEAPIDIIASWDLIRFNHTNILLV